MGSGRAEGQVGVECLASARDPDGHPRQPEGVEARRVWVRLCGLLSAFECSWPLPSHVESEVLYLADHVEQRCPEHSKGWAAVFAVMQWVSGGSQAWDSAQVMVRYLADWPEDQTARAGLPLGPLPWLKLAQLCHGAWRDMQLE